MAVKTVDRFCEKEIKERVNSLSKDKKALLVLGARQVGKTYLIRKVLSDLGVPSFELNFLAHPEQAASFSGLYDPKEIVDRFALLSPVPLIKGQSVIFLDEIQACPSMITKIKFLVEEGSYRYVLSGSLLGVELASVESYPVGYISQLEMFPLTFLEFANAYGLSEPKISHLRDCFANRHPVEPSVHQEVLNLFHYYLGCGGMPEAVVDFIANKNLNSLYRCQKDIVSAYKKDFTKYERLDRRLDIISIYDNIATQINKQNRKFIFTLFNKEMKFDRYEHSFLFLAEAGVAYPCYIANEVRSPIALSKEKNNFKLYLNDVGLLLTAFSRRDREAIMIGGDSSINKGGLYENFVASMLSARSIQPFYYKDKNIGEIDFLVDTSFGVTAIEVKSGTDYTKHKALDNLLAKYPNVTPIVLSEANLYSDGALLYCPIYMAELIENGW